MPVKEIIIMLKVLTKVVPGVTEGSQSIFALNFSLFTLARSIFRIKNLQLLLCLISRTGLNTGLYCEGTCYLYVPVKKPQIRAQ